jgi:hypothetical protein
MMLSLVKMARVQNIHDLTQKPMFTRNKGVTVIFPAVLLQIKLKVVSYTDRLYEKFR